MEQPSTPPAERKLGFVFSATGGEYFRIWIVNTLLTIVTLGIYSAWAKVRNKQYFYGNTTLDGSAFEYTADPVRILKGRLLVFGFFVAYSLAASFYPVAEPVLFLLVLPLIPWVVIRAMAFNARYSSYRNVHFQFLGKYREALHVYITWMLAVVLSLGLIYPYVVYKRKKFLVDRSKFGMTPFAFKGEAGIFFRAFVVAACMPLAVVLVGIVLVAADTEALRELGPAYLVTQVYPIVLILLFYLAFFAAAIYVQVRVTNHIWQNTSLDSNHFDMRLEFLPLLWIHLSNLVLIVASVGLLYPWAKVRATRYMLSRFAMTTREGVAVLAAEQKDRVAAAGAEFGEAWDLDLGL